MLISVGKEKEDKGDIVLSHSEGKKKNVFTASNEEYVSKKNYHLLFF